MKTLAKILREELFRNDIDEDSYKRKVRLNAAQHDSKIRELAKHYNEHWYGEVLDYNDDGNFTLEIGPHREWVNDIYGLEHKMLDDLIHDAGIHGIKNFKVINIPFALRFWDDDVFDFKNTSWTCGEFDFRINTYVRGAEDKEKITIKVVGFSLDCEIFKYFGNPKTYGTCDIIFENCNIKIGAIEKEHDSYVGFMPNFILKNSKFNVGGKNMSQKDLNDFFEAKFHHLYKTTEDIKLPYVKVIDYNSKTKIVTLKPAALGPTQVKELIEAYRKQCFDSQLVFKGNSSKPGLTLVPNPTSDFSSGITFYGMPKYMDKPHIVVEGTLKICDDLTNNTDFGSFTISFLNAQCDTLEINSDHKYKSDDDERHRLNINLKECSISVNKNIRITGKGRIPNIKYDLYTRIWLNHKFVKQGRLYYMIQDAFKGIKLSPIG